MAKKKIEDEVVYMYDDTELEALAKLSKDLRESAKILRKREARYLVDTYYKLQHYRIQAGNQLAITGEEIAVGKGIGILEEKIVQGRKVRTLFNKKTKKKILADEKRKMVYKENRLQDKFMIWTYESTSKLEEVVKKALDVYSKELTIGQWMHSICGIGPVIAAGLLAHIDMHYHNKEKGEQPGSMTPAKIWRYAGLDPTSEWKKGEKRPFNARLKLLCWKLGNSFVKSQGAKNSFYGPLYKKQREYDDGRNERGEFARLASEQLVKKNYSKDTVAKRAYVQGKLPDSHVFEYSKRKIVQLFISHLWEVWYEIEFGRKPPRPWIFAIGPNRKPHDMSHYIPPPNWPMKK